MLEIAGRPFPSNKPGNDLSSDDLLLRRFDCAVINFLHSQREGKNQKSFDSVRGVFWEGNDVYPGAGFKKSYSNPHPQSQLHQRVFSSP